MAKSIKTLELELKEILLSKKVYDRLRETKQVVERHEEETALYLKPTSRAKVEKIGKYRI